MKVTKFAAPLGASITDLDVRNVTDDHVSQLHGLFGEHQVLVFSAPRTNSRRSAAVREALGTAGNSTHTTRTSTTPKSSA